MKTLPRLPTPTTTGATQDGDYEDVTVSAMSASMERVRELDYVLTPGRYVGLPDEEDDFDFAERFAELQAELAEQLAEESRLNASDSGEFGKGGYCDE